MEKRLYRYPTRQIIMMIDGSKKEFKNWTTIHYKCKLYHPTAEEMAEIVDMIEGGFTKVDIMKRYNIGTYPRLQRLIAKYKAGLAAAADMVLN